MKNWLFLLIFSLLSLSFIFKFDTVESSNKNLKIFFSEITNTGAYDLGSKYYIYDLATRIKKEITSKYLNNVFNGTPRISMNGKYLAFFIKDNQKQYIRLLDLHKDTLEYNLEIPILAGELRISNDCKYLSLYINANRRDTKTKEIYLINMESKEIIQVTNNNILDYNPIISPNNNSLNFLQEESFTKTILKRYLFDSRLTENIIVFSDTGYQLYQWLNDDNILLTRKENYGTPFILHLKTGKITDLNLDRIYEIAISPDGKKMVYSRAQGYDDPTWDLFISDIDGKNVIKIPYRNNIDIMSPQWVME